MANTSAGSAGGAPGIQTIKLPDLHWVNPFECKVSFATVLSSKDENLKAIFRKEFRLWKESHKATAEYMLAAKHVPDKADQVSLWKLSLLRGLRKDPDLVHEVSVAVGEGKECANLLEAVSDVATEKKEIGAKSSREKLLALRRNLGKEDIVSAVGRLKKCLRDGGKAGYTAPDDLKKRALENVLTKFEYTDALEKATEKHDKKIATLTYDEILPFVERKVEATELLAVKVAIEGQGSRSSSSRPHHEYGAAASGLRGRFEKGKGGKEKKGKKRETSFQSSGDRDGNAGAAAASSQGGSSSSSRLCPNCGHLKHYDEAKGCPAKNVRCSVPGCNQTGHYTKCYPLKKQKQQQAAAAGVTVQKRTKFELHEVPQGTFTDQDF
uniref:Uncharacterized protein n=1 Tax=Chromera velia CCMP2878 TaxID=1169474 RepID=A0A0G4FPD1_9ALVE|eukprot:Cvel_18078.t1-p1 / transcript=Cvel_18078.t1 / gene=Cvel_18078 / organism=Chromera_velia_CCMP2878 / gene_product=hypothetical protein / transcript_product=hypothetical protein / location=Cvel_scaffold1478:35283-36422(-) / protein_length=380 / sequence_SO=supercontig / SO=protein_coding / is_pseudo=false